MPNRRQGSEQANDATSRDRTRTDVKNVGAAYVVRRHIGDWHRSRRNDPGDAFTKELDGGDQYQVSKDPTCAHDRADARANNVADTKQGRFNRR